MTTNQIKYFIEIAKYLSFTKASERLYVSQSTLSRQIISLESEVGAQLFTRINNTVHLTNAGNIFLKGITQIYKDLNELCDRVCTAEKGVMGFLHIGLLEDLEINPVIYSALEYFKNQLPDVSINMRRLAFKELRDGLHDGTLDIALSAEVKRTPDECIASCTYMKDKKVIAVPVNHPAANTEKIPLDQLGKYFNDDTLILIESEEMDSLRHDSVAEFEGIGFAPQIRYVPLPRDRALLVSVGAGISIANRYNILSFTPTVRTVEIEGDRDLNLTAEINRNNTNPQVKTFLDKLLEPESQSNLFR